MKILAFERELQLVSPDASKRFAGEEARKA
jgi:hypothetical protein